MEINKYEAHMFVWKARVYLYDNFKVKLFHLSFYST